MFFLYGPQAPTAFANGPSCTQFQAEWVEHLLKRAQEEGVTRLEATAETEDEWYASAYSFMSFCLLSADELATGVHKPTQSTTLCSIARHLAGTTALISRARKLSR